MIKREDIYYDSRDEVSRIHAVCWIPEERPKAIFQIIHGMQEYAARYDEFATYLAGKGYLVVAEDHLGHGLSSKPEDYGYFCEDDAPTVVVRDVHRLKKMVQEQYPGIPIILMGHSMGSFILRNYLCRYGTGIQGAIIMSTGSMSGFVLQSGVFMSKFIAAFESEGLHYRSPMMENISFGSYNKRIANPKTKLDWLSANEENVQEYIADKMCGVPFTLNGYITLFRLIKGAQKQKNLDKMPKDLPILITGGADDPVGHYGKDLTSLFGKYSKMHIQDVTLKMYSGLRHEILNESNKLEIYADVYNWTEAVIMNYRK